MWPSPVKRRGQYPADRLFVVRNQNASYEAAHHALTGRVTVIAAPPLAAVLGADVAAVDGDDALADRETEAAAARLGGEEGLEDALDILLREAGTGVGDLDAQELPGSGCARLF